MLLRPAGRDDLLLLLSLSGGTGSGLTLLTLSTDSDDGELLLSATVGTVSFGGDNRRGRDKRRRGC